MTDQRLKAAWLRTFAGLAVFLGLLVLGGCGGGSGAPNPTFNPITALALSPNIANVYPNTPVTFTVNGGRRPYSLFSSDQSAVPVPVAFNGNAFTIIPTTVAAETAVTLTVRDADGNTAASALTLRPAPFVASLTLKADGFSASCPNPGGSSSAIDANGQTFICSGQTGSVAVKVQTPVGGGIAGRPVRFDVVQGDFQIFTNAPGQTPTFGLSYTVPTDQNGDAIVRVRATPNANQQMVIVQATDLLTGTFVRGIFIIINGAGQEITVVPDEVTITGPDSETCSTGATASFFIFGGLPPYTISNTIPQGLVIEPTVVTASGAGFNATTTGFCLDTVQIAITDAAGHTTTVAFNNELGTRTPASTSTPIDIVTSPTTIPSLTCGATTSIVATGGGFVTETGGSATVTPPESYFVSVNRPDIVTIMTPAPSPGEAFTLTRTVPTTATTNTVTPPPSSALVNITLTISDGSQVVTRNVQVTNSCTGP